MPQADTVGAYLDSYAQQLKDALGRVSKDELEEAFNFLHGALKQGARIYVGGNGGSAAISDHLCCDWLKGTHVSGRQALRVHSLVSNVSLLTALANDYGYEHTLAWQLENVGQPGDVVVLISSSGNSPNIVAAAEVARAKGLRVIGLSGFSGGKLAKLADVNLHVPVNNYGIAEDAHQALMHVLAQHLAQLRDSEK